MDRGELLLLENLRGDIADGNDQLTSRPDVTHRCRTHLEVTVVVGLKRSATFFAGRQSRVKRANIGTHDFRIAHHLVDGVAHGIMPVLALP